MCLLSLFAQLPPEHYAGRGRPIPIFSYNSRAGDFLDFLLPDYRIASAGARTPVRSPLCVPRCLNI